MRPALSNDRDQADPVTDHRLADVGGQRLVLGPRVPPDKPVAPSESPLSTIL